MADHADSTPAPDVEAPRRRKGYDEMLALEGAVEDARRAGCILKVLAEDVLDDRADQPGSISNDIRKKFSGLKGYTILVLTDDQMMAMEEVISLVHLRCEDAVKACGVAWAVAL